MKKIILETNEKIRVDEFLRNKLPSCPELKSASGEISNSKIRRLIVAGCVFVNGKNVNRPAFELRGHSAVCVEFDEDKFFYEKQPDDIQFEVKDCDVLFEDENLIFINKPAFFPVEQTIVGNRSNLHDAVVDYLWKRNPDLRNPPYVGIMHRLDRETSGVILFTKNRQINKAVSDMFQNHDFIKEYIAVCCAEKSRFKTGDKFTVEKTIGRISGKSQAAKWGSLPESKGGLYSKTDFSVLSEKVFNGKKCLVLKCNLYTGRTHQIRVHLSEEGLPILGDVLYGGKTADRIHLHASRLCAKTSELDFDVKSESNWN